MRHISGWTRLSLTLGLLLLLYGCSEDSADTPLDPGGLPADVVPEFSLLDVNPNSATKDSRLSPRDYLQTVSAWYFGHAT